MHRAPVPDVHTQCTHQFLTCMLSMFWRDCAQCTHQFWTPVLHTLISSWCVCSMYTLVPEPQAQCMHQFLTWMLRANKMNIWKFGKLMCTLNMNARKLISMIRVRISPWRAHSVHASVPCPYAQCGHVEWTHFPRALYLFILLKHLNGKLFTDATSFFVLFYQMS